MLDLATLAFNPTSYGVARGLDFWLGAIGFVITLATFVLGWKKLARVQTAADAAAEAVKDVKLRFRRYDAILDAADALHSLTEIHRYLELEDWKLVVDAMVNVKHTIIRVDQSMIFINPDIAKSLRRVSSKLEKHITGIERSSTDVSMRPDNQSIRESIRQGAEAFVRAQRALEDHV